MTSGSPGGAATGAGAAGASGGAMPQSVPAQSAGNLSELPYGQPDYLNQQDRKQYAQLAQSGIAGAGAAFAQPGPRGAAPMVGGAGQSMQLNPNMFTIPKRRFNFPNVANASLKGLTPDNLA